MTVHVVVPVPLKTTLWQVSPVFVQPLSSPSFTVYVPGLSVSVVDAVPPEVESWNAEKPVPLKLKVPSPPTVFFTTLSFGQFTVTVAVPELLPVAGSPVVLDAVAVFPSEPHGAEDATARTIVMIKLLFLCNCLSPLVMEHVTVPLVSVQAILLQFPSELLGETVADTKVKPAGTGSVIVMSSASFGPALDTVRV